MQSLKSRFWLWLYKYAGKRVGPEVEDYWDAHWDRLVVLRLAELQDSNLGPSFVKYLFYEKGEAPRPVRNIRDRVRNVRDVR